MSPKPIPSTSSKTSLTSLPPDILSQIVDFLHDTSPASLSKLSLVNSQLHRLAQYSQHETVRLQILDDTLSERCRYIESAALQAAVRHLVIYDCRGSNDLLKPEYQSHIDIICSILPKLTGLKWLSYRRYEVPAAILNVLPPSVKLAAMFPGRIEWDPGEEQLLRLYNNASLSTLNVQLTWVDEKECRRMMMYLKKVLLSCPKLTSLTLDVSQPTSGCVVFQPSGEYVGLGFEPGETMPPLEELNLIKYEFGRVSQGSGSEIDYWVNAFDWSKLKKLKTGYEEFALKAAAHFTSLEEIHFLKTWWNPTMHEFLATVASSLRAINAPTLKSVSFEGLMRHSKTLEMLRLHRQEDYDDTWKNDCVDLDTLQAFQSSFPCLSELTVDVARSCEWPLEILDALAGFPRLLVLDLWFELGMKDRECPTTPLLTLDTVQYVCHYLHSRSRSLQQVYLHSGSPPSIGYGLMVEEAYWPQQNSTSFSCEMFGRPEGGSLTVTCPELEQRKRDLRRCKEEESKIRKPISVEIRELLTRTFRPERYRKKKAEVEYFTDVGCARRRRDQAALIAREGPTPLSRWNRHCW